MMYPNEYTYLLEVTYQQSTFGYIWSALYDWLLVGVRHQIVINNLKRACEKKACHSWCALILN